MRYVAVVGAITLLGCWDLGPAPKEPDMSGGWQAIRDCVPTDCVHRLWAMSPRNQGASGFEYDIADTVFLGDGSIAQTSTGSMTVNARHLFIQYVTAGTDKSDWTLFTEGPLKSRDEFTAVETWRDVNSPQYVDRGPWTFRRLR